jgi:hypothetical protein
VGENETKKVGFFKNLKKTFDKLVHSKEETRQLAIYEIEFVRKFNFT